MLSRRSPRHAQRAQEQLARVALSASATCHGVRRPTKSRAACVSGAAREAHAARSCHVIAHTRAALLACVGASQPAATSATASAVRGLASRLRPAVMLCSTRMSTAAWAAVPARLASARAPSCIAGRALRTAAAAPGAAAASLPWCWRVSRPPLGRGVRAGLPVLTRARVRAASSASGAGASGAPGWLARRPPRLICPPARADAAVPGKRAEELAKNFDHLATEERLYQWCAAGAAPHPLTRTASPDSRRPPLRQVGGGGLLPPERRWRAVCHRHAAAQRHGRAPHGPRHVCHAAGARAAAATSFAGRC